MSLELRCPKHPYYRGDERPMPDTCTDCWELFRQYHEARGNPLARKDMGR